MLAPPRGLSQRATSFIASLCQGIHRMLLSRLIDFIFVFMHGEDCAAIRRSQHTRPRHALNTLDDVKVHPMPQPAALARTDEPSIHDVIEPPARLRATTNLFLLRAQFKELVEPDGIEPTT